MYDILFNPISGKGRSQKVLTRITNELNTRKIDFRLHSTEYPGHATFITADLNGAQSHTDLIVIGGDGSFNEVLNGIIDFDKINLGFIPAGTGNDYAKAAGIPLNPLKALELILAGKTKKTDYMQLTGKRALNCAGAGMDTDVLVRYSQMKAFRGKVKYYASLIDVLLKLKFHRAKITVNGKTIETEVFLVACANGKYIGGGMPISPLSDPSDGLMNVIVVNKIKAYKVFPLLLKFLRGKHIYEPCAESYLVTEAKIEICDEGSTQIDGEVQKTKILDVKIVPSRLSVFTAD